MTNRLRHIFQTLFPRPTAAPPQHAPTPPPQPEAPALPDPPALAGLDAIDWPSLHHAYGPATDVPGQLRALTSPRRKAREAAVYELYGNIWHQGTVWQATPHAVPFLIRLVADPATPDRHELLSLLGSLATGEHKVFAEPTHSAVAAGFDHYTPLLTDPDWRARATAANLLASIPDRADAATPLLHRSADAEAHTLTRCALWLALARLADASPPTLDRLAGALAHAPDVRERFAAAATLVLLQGPAAPADARDVVSEIARDEWIANALLSGLPWDWTDDVNPGTLADRLGTTPEDLPAPPARCPADPLAPYTDALAAATAADEATGLAAAILFVAFPPAQPLTQTPWTARQVRALDAIVNADTLWRPTSHTMYLLHARGLCFDRNRPTNVSSYRNWMRGLLQ